MKMPLKKGKKAIGQNIREMVESSTFGTGKSKAKRREMAVVAALEKARRGGVKISRKKK